jgi:hypothetical protein
MVELKAVSILNDLHLAQAMNYLEAYNLPIGLLINFGSKSMEFKRAYNTKHPDNNFKRFSYPNTRSNPVILQILKIIVKELRFS